LSSCSSSSSVMCWTACWRFRSAYALTPTGPRPSGRAGRLRRRCSAAQGGSSGGSGTARCAGCRRLAYGYDVIGRTSPPPNWAATFAGTTIRYRPSP
jgi:hypothetical protein